MLAAGGELDRALVEDELLAAAADIGLGETESAASARSGLNAGARDPRRRPPLGRGPDGFEPNSPVTQTRDLGVFVAAFDGFPHSMYWNATPASVRRVLSTWRGFGRHLVAADYLLSNPVDGLIGPKRPEWMPKALEYAELERIAQAAGSTDPRARHPWPERDAALFAVFAGAGVRSGEAIAMQVGSVEAAERSPRLRVLGKGNKPRVIPVGPEVVAAVDRYLDTRVERAGSHSPTDPLFVRRLRAAYVPFNLQAMDGLVAGWYRRAGVIPPPGSLAHALRHTYATLLVDAGRPSRQPLSGSRDAYPGRGTNIEESLRSAVTGQAGSQL